MNRDETSVTRIQVTLFKAAIERVRCLHKSLLPFFFVVYFFTLLKFRPYHFELTAGYIDPWISLGYGQSFPETAFPGHYYKESRIVNIFFTYVILRLDPRYFSEVCTLLVMITGLLAFKFCKNITSSNFVGVAALIVVTWNPIIWGDAALGGDYYNTLGNLIIVILLIRIVMPGLVLGKHNVPIGRTKQIESGLLLTLAALEIPSGIVVVAAVGLFLVFTCSSATSRFTVIGLKNIFSLAFNLGLGSGIFIILESVFLLLFRQSPIRLLAGPKFLLDSIINPEMQSSWWEPLGLNDILALPTAMYFAVFFILMSMYFLDLLMTRFGTYSLKNTQNSAKNKLLLSTLMIYIIILFLQINGKTILLNISYSTTPLLIYTLVILFLLMEKISVLFPSSIIVGMALANGYIHSTEAVFVFVLFLIIAFFTQLRIPVMLRIPYALLIVLLPVHLTDTYKLLPGNSSREQFERCATYREQMRIDLIKASNELDEFGDRGSLIIGVTDDVFKKLIETNCSDFQGRPTSQYILSLASMGFPAASTLGAYLSEKNEDLESDYIYQTLGDLLGREKQPEGCYVMISLDSSDRKFKILDTTFYYSLICKTSIDKSESSHF